MKITKLTVIRIMSVVGASGIIAGAIVGKSNWAVAGTVYGLGGILWGFALFSGLFQQTEGRSSKATLYHCNFCSQDLPYGEMCITGSAYFGKEQNGICKTCFEKNKGLIFRGGESNGQA